MEKAIEPMTSGSIGKRMMFFALPLLLGNLFQQLYNTVDSLIVGNFLGSAPWQLSALRAALFLC